MYLIYTKPDKRLHITICDVGQGDAILIRTPANKNYLIDGGPDNKVLNCLGRKTPFYNRSIESISISHLHSDHITGVIETIKRYGVKNIVINTIKQNTPEVKELFSQLKNKHISVSTAFKGDHLQLGKEVTGQIFYPQPDSWNTQSGEWQAYLYDFNDSSTVFTLHYHKLMVLFTGDAGKDILDKVADSVEFKNEMQQSYARILKTPHHGSRDALSTRLLDTYAPQLALISAGKNNSFGHPHQEVIQEYQKRNISIARTDLNGDIELISDGSQFAVKLEKKPHK